jgi:hypothetical protein
MKLYFNVVLFILVNILSVGFVIPVGINYTNDLVVFLTIIYVLFVMVPIDYYWIDFIVKTSKKGKGNEKVD